MPAAPSSTSINYYSCLAGRIHELPTPLGPCDANFIETKSQGSETFGQSGRDGTCIGSGLSGASCALNYFIYSGRSFQIIDCLR